MNAFPSRRWAGPLVAGALVLVMGFAAAPPRPAGGNLNGIASSFRLATPVAIPSVPGTPKNVRKVHPSLVRISSWISSVGASAALGDVDGDGLPNDLCLVDPRTDLVSLQPLSGTLKPDGGSRYGQIVLDAAPLPFSAATMAPMGCMFSDLNEDGFADLAVYFWGRTPIAFLQIPSNSGATLTRASFKGIELVDRQERWFTNAATSADFDGDGHVDLIFANYFPDGSDILNAEGAGRSSMHSTMSKSFTGGLKHFLIWRGAKSGSDPDATFKHMTPLSVEELAGGWTLAVGAGDLDGDLLPEIYLSNDFGPDRLLYNRSTDGQLSFVTLEGERGFFTPKSAVLGQDSFKGMGIDFADVNNDGELDLFVSNIAAPFSLNESHMMWINTGDHTAFSRGIAPFVQLSEPLGLSRSGWGWDAKFADLNNSGSLALIQATGFLKGKTNRWAELQALATSNDQIMSNPELWPAFRPGDDLSGNQPNAIFARDADGRFFDISPKLEPDVLGVSSELGLNAPSITRGVAVADVDGDGALDFVYANQWDDSTFIHNECRDCGAYLGLRLLRQVEPGALAAEVLPGLPPNVRLSPAIGAVVTAKTPDGRKFCSQVDGGNGHSGRRSQDVHIGLGHLSKDATIDVEIRWRTFSGKCRQTKISVKSGWNTVLLGSQGGAQCHSLIP